MVHRNGRIAFGLVVIPLGVSWLGTLAVPLTRAEESTIEFNSPDVLRQILEQQVGKRVKVKLLRAGCGLTASGQSQRRRSP